MALNDRWQAPNFECPFNINSIAARTLLAITTAKIRSIGVKMRSSFLVIASLRPMAAASPDLANDCFRVFFDSFISAVRMGTIHAASLLACITPVS
jgi:hypothetical protein